MKVWTNTQFTGLWPVGTAAVVVADTQAEAAVLLNAELDKRGLTGDATPEQFQPLKTNRPLAVVLRDGEY